MKIFGIFVLLIGILTAIFSSGKYGLILIFIVLGITALSTLISIILQLVRTNRVKGYKESITLLKFIAKFALLFLTTGTFLYILAFITIGEENLPNVFFSNTEIFFRSLFCSLDLFFLNIDSNIIDRIDNHPDLKTWIFIQAILSALTTIVMFLSLVLSRIKEYWKLNFLTKVTKEKSHLYIFFGLNHASELLAKDIKCNDANSIIIFVDKAKIDSEKTNGFENILSLLSHNSASFSFSKNLDAAITVATSSPSEVDIPEDVADVFALMDVPKIKKLIKRLSSPDISSPQLHLLFLSENENKNVRDILTILKDSTIGQISDFTPLIYCHARKSGPYSFIEELGIKQNCEIRIVDSSFIAIENLKQQEKYHPVNLVRLSDMNLGTISSPLNCLIVGFGEVGRDGLRFLYEFGAFPDERSSVYDSFRSPFKCKVIDQRMDEIKGRFLQSAPALSYPEAGVDFHTMNTNDSRFLTSVLDDEFAKKLNYVLLSTGKDEENLDIALKICNKCWEAGNPMTDIMILVKCGDDSKIDFVKKSAAFFNTTYTSGKGVEVINIFGLPEHIFSYDLIIREQIENEAKAFFDGYQKQSNSKQTWAQRRLKFTTPPLSLLSLRELRRKESQDYETALHCATKINILERTLGFDYNWQDFIQRYFLPNGEANQTGNGDSITYPELSQKENHLILNLAILEHLRWIASHELLGYTPCHDETECDERLKRHPCLRPWQELDELSRNAKNDSWTPDYKIYDFYVIDTTISINKWRWISNSELNN